MLLYFVYIDKRGDSEIKIKFTFEMHFAFKTLFKMNSLSKCFLEQKSVYWTFFKKLAIHLGGAYIKGKQNIA